jgi:gamma-glutamyltranspeptidase
MCGIGGDAFWLIYRAADKSLAFLNSSGRAPYAATRDYFRQAGLKSIPVRGILPVTVPGAVDGWFEAHSRYGKLPMTTLVETAVGYAREGYPVTHLLSQYIAGAAGELSRFPHSHKLFMPGGKTPAPGTKLTNPNLGASLEKIARGGRDVFYKGELAAEIVKFFKENGGLIREKDLAETQSTWGEPVSTTYRGYTVYETPPNSQGLAALLTLNLMEGFDFAPMGYHSPDHIHLMIEAKKLAFADRNRYISDPERVHMPVKELLSKEYAARRRTLIRHDRSTDVATIPAGNFGKDTIFLCTVDAEGNAVSLIQSLYFPFGSAVTAGDTGIVLQNRGAYFSLDPQDANCLEPRKRTFHTLMASMTFKDGKPYMLFGTSGADGQPQTHVQIMTGVFDFGLDIQRAIEAPRWLSGRKLVNQPEGTLTLEESFPPETIAGLKKRGHDVQLVEKISPDMGSAHGIIIDPESGLRMGATDPRSDGLAIGY